MLRKRLAVLLATVLCLLPGCRGREKSQSIRMDLQQRVTSLDPQFATAWESQVVLMNLFEGLLIRGEDGELAPGAAREYTVSADGLTYTFQLRQDGVWRDGDPGRDIPPSPVTAADFVFSFHRIFDPEVPSPWAGDFQAIRNAREVLAGELPKSQLGVRARGDYTLEITLSEPSPVLLELLAGTGALPCNETFFRSTRARYGQAASHILGNGPFALQSWDDEAVVMVPSGSYTGTQQVLCPSVVLYTGRAKEKGTTEWQLFLEGRSDFCAATSQQARELDQERFHIAPTEDTVWALVFRQEEGSPLADAGVRRALALTVDAGSFGERTPEDFLPTTSLVPRSATLMGEEYQSGASPLGFRPDEAREVMAEALARLELEALPKTTLILPGSAGLGPVGGYLQKVWQQELRQFINLEIVEDDAFQQRLEAGEFEMAITPLGSEGNTPMGALGVFATGNSRNVAGHQDPGFDLLLAQSQTAPDARQAAALCDQCEGMLLEQAVAVPLFTQQGYCAMAAGLEGLDYRSDRILFAGASRTGG